MLDKAFFSPKSVAVIGASVDPDKLGHSVLKNILDYGFKGRVYVVNPAVDQIMGLKSYAKITDITEAVELAILVVPAKTVPTVVSECGQKGVRGIVVISAGFKETGIEGFKLENQLVTLAKSYGIRVLGPNCLGFIDTSSSLNATFASGMAAKGNISFLSQSGALCQAVLDWSQDKFVGFSKFVSLGNMADVNESDIIESWKEDEDTAVVMAYLEGVSDGERFRKAAAALTRVKPLILLKSGATAAGSRAASSHTGSLAGFDVAYDTVFRQTGVIRVQSMEEIIDFALAFSNQPLIKGNKIAVVTNAGGPGIMAADACERVGLKLSSFSRKTIEKLQSCLPPVANFYNPVDVIGDAGPERYQATLEILIDDQNVDGILVLLTPQAVTDVEKTAGVIIEATRNSTKPVLTSFMGGPAVSAGIKQLNRSGIPNYSIPERAVNSFQAMHRYYTWLNKKKESTVSIPVNKEKAGIILERAMASKRQHLSDIEARQVIGAYGMALPVSRLAHNSSQAVKFADEVGYPVAMKIASPDILHKTDIGGVKVGLGDSQAVKNAYLEIMTSAHRLMPQAHILGVDVQALVKGREVILGMNRDAQFGPMLMFGLGGIYVEVLKDVSFRIAPITRQDARNMISEIHSYPLLAGVRGEKPADISAIVDCLLRLAQLAIDFPQITELDINPLMVGEKGRGAIALDCRLAISL